MRRKGHKLTESPEKMPVITSGIEMTRGTREKNVPEHLTGGNGVADESKTSNLVLDFINIIRR
jgi:hypothetical protein